MCRNMSIRGDFLKQRRNIEQQDTCEVQFATHIMLMVYQLDHAIEYRFAFMVTYK